MASEYYKWKFRDVQQRKNQELTPEEKRKNWWYYHRYPVIACIIAGILLVDLIRTVAGMKTSDPDVAIALITDRTLSEETVSSLEDVLSAYADDYNGDRKVLVKVNTYLMPENPVTEEQMYAQYAAQITLIADIEECDSFLFIMQDPDAFQKSFEILCMPDGTLPEDLSSGSECAYAIADLSVMKSLPVEPDFYDYLSGFYIARRGFWTDKTVSSPEGCEQFFQAITAQNGN